MRRTNFGTGEPASPRTSRRIRTLPQDDAACGWIETLPPPPPARRLAGNQTADCVVLGAGFTGLAIARRLAELQPGARIVLLDAQRAGFGASGRSSGFVVDLAHFIARLPFEASRSYVELCRSGIRDLEGQVQAHVIPCDWDSRGWFHIAATEAGVLSLPMLRQWLDKLGEPYQWIESAELGELLGTGYYRVALRLPGSVLVQPAALVRGLAEHLPPGAELYEESPVRAIERSGGRFVLRVGESGRLETGRLFVAANGYSPALGLLQDRVFPLITFGSLTRPLSAEEQAGLGSEREWGLLAEDAMGSSLRRTRDQRILVRNTIHYHPSWKVSDALRREIRDKHRQSLLARFPALRDVPFEYTWGGLMGTSPNRGHCFGEIEPNLYSAASYTGAGIAMGTTAGTALAELALGVDSPAARGMLNLPEPKWLPPQPFLGIGARWQVWRMNASAPPGA